MIKESIPLSMSEASKYIKSSEETGAEMIGFIKKFTKLNSSEAEELRKKLEALGSMRVKAEHTAKIVDLMPENESDLNKIFSDVSLDEDETKKILETVKEFK